MYSPLSSRETCNLTTVYGNLLLHRKTERQRQDTQEMGRLPLITQGSLSFPEISCLSNVKAPQTGASPDAFALVRLSKLLSQLGKLSGRIQRH